MKKGVFASVMLFFILIILASGFVLAFELSSLINEGLQNNVIASESVNDASTESFQADMGTVIEPVQDKKIKTAEDADKQAEKVNRDFKKKGIKKTIEEANNRKTSKTIPKAELDKKLKEGKMTAGQAWNKYLQALTDNLKALTGRVIGDSYADLELPENPSEPGNYEDVIKPKSNFKILSFLTGDAIIGIPDWSFDGERFNGGWGASHTSSGEQHHFELKLESYDITKESNVNAIVYGKGYYLDEKKGRWVNFDFDGTHVGNTGWLREKGQASLTISNFTNSDYAVFLAYSCKKHNAGSDWNCNNGKWIVFVVEMGDVNYHQQIGQVPKMNYTEIKNLNITDIPSLLKQLNVSLFEAQPPLHDAFLASPELNIQTNIGKTEKMEFYVKNLGNKPLTNLSFELDIGEQVLADVVEAEIPESVAVNKTVRGSVTLLFKERGHWKFPLYLKAQQEEVDTSDNLAYFNVTVGEPITVKMPQDSLTNAWNRNINYTAREQYSILPYPTASNLYIISGTNRMRTIFGGYWQGKSINPTMNVFLEPIVTEEALFSTPYVASIVIGGRMLTGDREPVSYYAVIKNENNGKTYTTPLMESMYKYYYNPRELIPDFEFCVNYSSKVVLVGRTSETIDTVDPEIFNICGFGKEIYPFYTKRVQKLYEDYIQVGGGFNTKYFEEGEIRYKVEFTDPRNSSKKYETPIISTKDGFVLFKVSDIITREIKWRPGEDFLGRVILIDAPVARGNVPIKFSPMNDALHFIWKSWDMNIILKVGIRLKNGIITLNGKAYFWAGSSPELYDRNGYHKNALDMPWTTILQAYFTPISGAYLSKDEWKRVEEAIFDYKIRDATDNKIVFEHRFKARDYKAYGSIYPQIYYSFSGNPAIQLPNFTQGHYYEFSQVIEGDIKDLIVPAKPINIFYQDAYQFIANNPLLRTRFMNLENHPYGFVISGGSADGKKPIISIRYQAKNLYPNTETMQIDKVDVSNREIKLQNLATVMDADFSYDHVEAVEYEKGKTAPVFNGGIQIIIMKLGDKAPIIGRDQFNCKIGRYDLICKRGESGYSLVYIDEVNKFLYQIELSDRGGRFIKKYRDDPKVYDAVVYDILSEIDRNPIVSFYNNNYFEKNLIIPKQIFSGGMKDFDPSGENESYRELYGDYGLGIMGISSSAYPPFVTPSFIYGNIDKLNIKKDENLIASRDFTSQKNQMDYLELRKWINSLGLVNNGIYSLEITLKNKQDGVYYYAKPFVYKNNYDKEVLEDNRDYIKKIPEINSTILGPFGYYSTYARNYTQLRIMNVLDDYNGHSYPRMADSNLKSLFNSNKEFIAYFSVNPSAVKQFYPGEETTREEFISNTRGDRRYLLDSSRFYKFISLAYNDIYNYYTSAPINKNTFDTRLSGIECGSERKSDNYNGPDFKNATLILTCKWSNIDKLEIYQLKIAQFFQGKSINDLYNLDDNTLNSFKNYAEIVLNKYLQWHPNTPILNTTFETIK